MRIVPLTVTPHTFLDVPDATIEFDQQGELLVADIGDVPGSRHQELAPTRRQAMSARDVASEAIFELAVHAGLGIA